MWPLTNETNLLEGRPFGKSVEKEDIDVPSVV